MKTICCKWAMACVLAALLPSAAVHAEAAAVDTLSGPSSAMHNLQGIRGVWDSTVRLAVCGGGPTLRTFRALNLFESDGSLVATSEVAQPPSLGKWRWLGGNRFRAQFRFQRFGAGGVFEGVTQVAREIRLAADGRSFTGQVATQMYDITGTVVAEGCGTEEATRVF